MTKSIKLKTICISTALFFPGCEYNATLGNRDQINALEGVATTGEDVFVLTKTADDTGELVNVEKLARVGTVCRLTKFIRNNISEASITVEAVVRGEGLVYSETPTGITAEVVLLHDADLSEREEGLAKKLMTSIRGQLREIGKIDGRINAVVSPIIKDKKLSGSVFADKLADFFFAKIEERREILEERDVIKRLDILNSRLVREIDHMVIAQSVAKRARDSMDKQAKEHYLREQMKVIGDELGDDDDGRELRVRLEQSDVPDEVREKLKRDIARMERSHPMSGEIGVLRNYVETVLDLPWTKTSQDESDLVVARKQLDRDHYNIEDVKDRILEHIAVMQLCARDGNAPPGQILCLVGPPGVGKTSVAESVAKALGREFIRASLGGVRDESEIRGHRRTYVGALPGKIIAGMKRAGTVNPVFLFDEIDKMASDFRGDPASAMLEVLDPVQNKTFSDHYLEVPYDLSRVLFICTANDADAIPWALQDRMEIIKLSSYTLIEKVKIARDFLLGRLCREHGIDAAKITIDDDAFRFIIESYTREAGVRELSRVISSLLRKVAMSIVNGKTKADDVVLLGAKTITELLGAVKFSKKDITLDDEVGVVKGLSYTAFGGDVLKIEVSLSPGKGELKLTGRLGDVMKESAQIALSVAKTFAQKYNIDPELFATRDIHIHVPSGAVPKDGPSAGAALTVALVSAFANKPVRGDWALTGEATLSGRVLEIGGVREKVLSAHRYGINNIILPTNNKKSLEKVPKEALDEMSFVYVDNIEQVLEKLVVK